MRNSKRLLGTLYGYDWNDDFRYFVKSIFILILSFAIVLMLQRLTWRRHNVAFMKLLTALVSFPVSACADYNFQFEFTTQ